MARFDSFTPKAMPTMMTAPGVRAARALVTVCREAPRPQPTRLEDRGWRTVRGLRDLSGIAFPAMDKEAFEG